MTIGGTTPSEKYLTKLCNDSFLSLWSYPNVFNNKGVVNGKGIGKEICDLLIVFGNDILIFSDKSCKYNDTGKLKTDWNRWYKKAIEKSADQLYGAERWIKSFPDRIFLDSAAKKPFPIDLPLAEKMRIHRIAVALGAKDSCRRHYQGGSGSLRINNELPSIMDSDNESIKAFTVGYFDESKRYVHIFDDVTLDIVLKELDTISDFCTYLRKKEYLISKTTLIAGGEEEILGLYLKNMDKDGKHGFGIDYNNCDLLSIDEGTWKDFSGNPQYSSKKQADKVSYVWDNIIEFFIQAHSSGNNYIAISTKEYERAIRKMAALSRFERRIVGQKIFEIVNTTKANQTRRSAVIMDKQNPNLSFAFVLLPPNSEISYDEYRQVRINLLIAYCNILKLKYPTLKEVIGIAFEPHIPQRGGSADLAYFDFSTWTEEQREQALEDKQMLDIDFKTTIINENEYPTLNYSSIKRTRIKKRKIPKIARRGRL